ncbi:hypothetical protein PIB30_060185 [Stylosanthes scabra]|uniref:Uncharacterized protein n=1 Tax=Stylosanthes scabra TaxID=79078 RepID=A0ABU6UJ82_9FABA|nr:hypothetical protein [Stylosanthes scabra]
MPGRRIPRWFEKRRSGASISFWFRGTISPLNALCVAILIKDDIPSPIQVTPIATINGYQVSSGKEIRVEQFLIYNLKGNIMICHYLLLKKDGIMWRFLIKHVEVPNSTTK